MKKYYFFYNEDNQFVCKIDGPISKEFIANEAKEILRRINRMKFNQVRASTKSINLSNQGHSIFITDLDLFYENHLNFILRDHMKKIEEALIKRQREKAKKRVCRNIILGANKVLVGAMLVSIIAGGTKFFINKLDDDKKIPKLTIETEDIIEPIVIEDEKEIVQDNDTQELLDELDNTTTTTLFYEDRSASGKAEYAYENYYDIVNNYAQKWGISANIPMSMLTQESGGIHTNLMQIQFDSWAEMPLKVYDFNDKKYKTYMLTNDQNKMTDPNITYITETDLQNPKTNISVGCIILRKSAEGMNYHIGASIQCYNFGKTNMNKVLETTSNMTGLSIEEILNDQSNLDFMDYTNIIDVGDPNYLNNVTSYNQVEEDYVIKRLNEQNEIIEERIRILPHQEKLAY